MHPLYARVRLHGHYYGQTSLVGTLQIGEWKKILAGLVPGPARVGGSGFHSLAHTRGQRRNRTLREEG